MRPPLRDRKFADSSLEGNGFEISVPRRIGSGFEASVGLGPTDGRRGGSTRAVVGLGKPMSCFGDSRSRHSPTEMKAPTLLAMQGIAELKFRIHSPPVRSLRTIGSAGDFS